MSTGISFATSGGQGAQRKAPCCTTRTVRGLSDMPWRSQAAQEQREERLMQQICLRTCVMILAAVLAHAAPAVCADAADHPLQTPADFGLPREAGPAPHEGDRPRVHVVYRLLHAGRDESGSIDRLCRVGRARHAEEDRWCCVLAHENGRAHLRAAASRRGAPRSPSNSIRATP